MAFCLILQMLQNVMHFSGCVVRHLQVIWSQLMDATSNSSLLTTHGITDGWKEFKPSKTRYWAVVISTQLDRSVLSNVCCIVFAFFGRVFWSYREKFKKKSGQPLKLLIFTESSQLNRDLISAQNTGSLKRKMLPAFRKSVHLCTRIVCEGDKHLCRRLIRTNSAIPGDTPLFWHCGL